MSTETEVVPKHAPEKKNPKTDPSVLESVLGDVAHERREAYLALRKRNTRVNREYAQLAENVTEAKSAITAHTRYKAHMTLQAWDEENRDLQAGSKRAEDALAAYQTKISASSEHLTMQARVAELDKEWKIHARYAEKVGIDLKPLWTPEKGFTDQELDAIAKDDAPAHPVEPKDSAAPE